MNFGENVLYVSENCVTGMKIWCCCFVHPPIQVPATILVILFPANSHPGWQKMTTQAFGSLPPAWRLRRSSLQVLTWLNSELVMEDLDLPLFLSLSPSFPSSLPFSFPLTFPVSLHSSLFLSLPP